MYLHLLAGHQERFRCMKADVRVDLDRLEAGSGSAEEEWSWDEIEGFVVVVGGEMIGRLKIGVAAVRARCL